MRSKVKVTINLPPEVLEKVKKLGINISSIAEEAINREIFLIENQKMLDLTK